LRRDLELLCDARVTLLSERRVTGPAGRAGGGAGATGVNVLIRGGVEKTLPGKVTFDGHAGDVISICSPGGGGWGPADRIHEPDPVPGRETTTPTFEPRARPPGAPTS
jgi:N-methylhydantoinase B